MFNCPAVFRLVLAGFLSLGATGLSSPSAAEAGCLLVVELEQGDIVEQSGDFCDERFTPASSFKLALAVMGFESGHLVDADTPKRVYKDKYKARRKAWKRDTTPTSWLDDSVVWYSQVLTREMGAEKFRAYLGAFDYGNRDLTPVKGRDDPLVSAWLSASLKISPREQIAFVSRLLNARLPVSGMAQEMAVSIVPGKIIGGGLSVFGKTGTGLQAHADGSLNYDRQIGWYVGWAEAGGKTYVFANLLVEQQKRKSPAGFRARDAAIDLLRRKLPNQ